MKEVKIQIDNYEDRQNMVRALANAGYKVWVEKEKDKNWALYDEYYVLFNF